MKTLIVGLFAGLLSFGAAAYNTQTAEELYQARGEKTDNAFKAYQAYVALAEAGTNSEVKAQDYWLAAQAVYFVGYKATDNSSRKKYHEMGYEVAAKAVALLGGSVSSLNDSQKESLANAYFWYGANLGKWGEANGVASSLSRWPELKNTMKKIAELKMNHVQDYGSYRILGRANYKLPYPLGTNKKALKFLEAAFENTKNGNDISHNGLNILYYADVLIAEDQKSTAKAILTSFVNKNPETFNVLRIPETKDEQVEARELLRKL